MKMESLDDWPKCSVPECEFKICLALDSPFCFKHTPGTTEEKHRQIDDNRAARG